MTPPQKTAPKDNPTNPQPSLGEQRRIVGALERCQTDEERYRLMASLLGLTSGLNEGIKADNETTHNEAAAL